MEEISPVTENTPKKLRAEHILAIIAGVLALITAVLTLICLPYMQKPQEDPQQLLQGGHSATMPPMPTADPEVPTEPIPEPEKSPYGKLDFQYEGRYLGCIKADTIPGVDVSSTFFAPIDSLVAGTITIDDYAELVKTNSALMRENLLG